MQVRSIPGYYNPDSIEQIVRHNLPRYDLILVSVSCEVAKPRIAIIPIDSKIGGGMF